MKNKWFGLVFFGFLWSGFILFIDILVGHGMVKQFFTKSFPSVTGYVTHSEMTVHHGKGTSYGVDINYHYEVNGQSFQGHRFRYGTEASDFDWADRTVKLYHMGAEVPVYYNSSNPSESLLSPGIEASDLATILFLTPFNAVMAGFCMTGLAVLRVKFSESPNGGIPFHQDGVLTRICLPRFPTYLLPLIFTGFVAFVEIFPLAIFGALHSRFEIVGLAILIAYGSGLIALLWQLRKNRSGEFDLVFDRSRQRVELPQTFGRKTRIAVELSDIRGLHVETVAERGSKGGTTYKFIPTLSWRSGKSVSGKLAEFYNKSRAEKFVQWLRPLLNKDAGQDSESIPNSNLHSNL